MELTLHNCQLKSVSISVRSRGKKRRARAFLPIASGYSEWDGAFARASTIETAASPSHHAFSLTPGGAALRWRERTSSMPRQTLTIISGIAILVAHWHCTLGHGNLHHVCPENLPGATSFSGDSVNNPTPATDDSHDCENHFGCICKGATFGILFSWVDSTDFQFLSLPLTVFDSRLTNHPCVSCKIPFWHSLRSTTALQICAQLQSFQL